MAVLRPRSDTFKQEQEIVTTLRVAALKTEKQELSICPSDLSTFLRSLRYLALYTPPPPPCVAFSSFKKTEVTTTGFRDGLKTKTGC